MHGSARTAKSNQQTEWRKLIICVLPFTASNHRHLRSRAGSSDNLLEKHPVTFANSAVNERVSFNQYSTQIGVAEIGRLGLRGINRHTNVAARP
jgi:hypothetical protein